MSLHPPYPIHIHRSDQVKAQSSAKALVQFEEGATLGVQQLAALPRFQPAPPGTPGPRDSPGPGVH